LTLVCLSLVVVVVVVVFATLHYHEACSRLTKLMFSFAFDKPVRAQQIHQLAGHLHKVTNVRILSNNRNILTCSADRTMKLWDISKQTYRQLTTMSFNSFASSIDVVADGRSAISGHVDGSLLFWDLETAQKTAEIKGTLWYRALLMVPARTDGLTILGRQ
jgi:WD40 repeat protein